MLFILFYLWFFFSTTFIAPVYPVEIPTPCSPSPCGTNTVCKERNGVGSCSCLPEYFGDPYVGCRPECLSNNDCARDKACIQNKCKNPCPGICGVNAYCQTLNHNPSCSCNEGYTGDPLRSCHTIPQKPRKRKAQSFTCKSYKFIFSQFIKILKTHVFHLHAVQIHNVERLTLMQYVHVDPVILELLQIVDLNASLALSVLKTKLVSVKNV